METSTHVMARYGDGKQTGGAPDGSVMGGQGRVFNKGRVVEEWNWALGRGLE
jgi:hypothetical protein